MIELRSYELISGRKNLVSVLNTIDIRERELREADKQDVIRMVYYEKRKEEDEKQLREVYYVNGVVVTVNYSGNCVPVSAFGTPEKLDDSLPILTKLIGEELREVKDLRRPLT